MERYFDQMQDLSYAFSSLIAEAFGLGPNGLSQFYDSPELMQHRGKIVRYPAVEGQNDQGVGPHFDSGFLTFVRPTSGVDTNIQIFDGRFHSCFKLHRTEACRYKT